MTDERALQTTSARVLTRQRLLVMCVALLIALGTSSSGQTPAVDNSPAAAAARAFNRGQYDQIDSLLGAATDDRSIAIRGRAAIARGRYADAEKLLSSKVPTTPAGDSALELGLLQMYLGRKAEGVRTLTAVMTRGADTTAADLLRLGRAARGLGRFQDANMFLRDAARLAPEDPVINTEWGEVFLDKYNVADAVKSFEAALEAQMDYVPARVGLARVTLEQDPPKAASAAEAALMVNPNYVPAHLLLAELALDDRKRDEARASIKKALDVNPNSLEARALDAAIAFLEARTTDFESTVAGLLKINPTYSDAYRVTGDQLGRNYRFEEAEQMTRKALALDPENTHAYADLGSHLLRIGDEPGARRALETAFKADPYDVVTYNELAMLDTVDKFETIRDGDLVIRLHPDEAAVMREQVPALARQALETLSKLYQFRPTGPILIEMFPKHDDFAVRTIGLPGFVGALGACFGKVVTLDSPRARPPGLFNWQETLWHEMAHVYQLQMSNNRFPRWLSEGMSVFEERRGRPEWGNEMEVTFAQALDAGKVAKLRDIQEALIDPRTTSLVYHQSSLVVAYLFETYGDQAIFRLLRAYGRGLETDAAFKDAFNVTLEDVEAGYLAKVRKDTEALRLALKAPANVPEKPSLDQLKTLAGDNPGSAMLQMRLAQAQFEADDLNGALATLERASKLVPQMAGEQSPNALIAVIAIKQGNKPRAIQALEAIVRTDPSDIDSARELAKLLEPLGDATKTAVAFQRVAELDPFDATAQAFVGRFAMQQKDPNRAIRAFRTAIAAGAPDKAVAHLDLAEAYFAAGQSDNAKRETLASLEIAPSFEKAQDLLLKIAGGNP